MAKRVVVVLGEAGMGKTWEFEDQVRRLQADGKKAFFLSLSHVTSSETFALALGDHKDEFDAWSNSELPGYFFLDAVDESCLKGPIAFEHALAYIVAALTPHLERVSIFLSSRISDWQLATIRHVVDRRVLAPLNRTQPHSKHMKVRGRIQEDKATVEDFRAEVVRLAGLSAVEAKRLAVAHGAFPVEAFWKDVEDGDYERLAGRPRDIEWMAKRWSLHKQLGSYSELLEASISHRLREKNEGYIGVGAVLSQEMMRHGAEQLAAACVFCRKACVSMPGDESGVIDLTPSDVLPKWDGNMQRRLLGMALFDEATYGRVKFHHRTATEYLAAWWIARRLQDGLPLEEALSLFGGSPYGDPVLMNGTRATLCWLTTLNAHVREHVIQHFPEMLMFEGDPDSWSDADVTDGFQGYIRRLNFGFRPDWWNDLSELRRVARRLPASLLNDLLKDNPDSVRVTSSLLSLISHGHITGCASEVFRMYRSDARTTRFQLYALEVLETLATDQQRTEIRTDLIGGRLDSNEMLAAALRVAKIDSLSLDELIGIFKNTQVEEEYGTGPMARAINRALPELDLDASLKVLEAIYRVLPKSDRHGERVISGEVREQDAWKLRVLPQCLLHVVNLIPHLGENAPAVAKEAALYVEELRHTRFAKDEEFRELREAIEKKPAFRRDLILVIAATEKTSSASRRLLWDRGQISIQTNELDWIIELSNSLDSIGEGRNTWFNLAVEIAFCLPSTQERARAFKAMTAIGGDAAVSRKSYIENAKAEFLVSTNLRKKSDANERRRKKRVAEQITRNKEKLLKDLDSIRDGTYFNAIQWLLERGASGNYTNVNVEPVREDFGEEIAAAFSQGLAKLWMHHEAPDLLKYPGNEVPWIGLIGLASVNHAFALGLDALSLSEHDVRKTVRLCVWELDAMPDWARELSCLRADTVIATLRPWFEHELKSSAKEATWFRAVDLVFKSPREVREPLTKVAVDLLLGGEVDNPRLQERIFDDGIDLGLLERGAVEALVISKFDAPHNVIPEEAKQKWLRRWIAFDLEAAWSWVRGHTANLRTSSQDFVVYIANVLADSNWTDRLSGTTEELTTLIAIYRFLSPHVDAVVGSADKREERNQNPARSVREAISTVIGKLPGTAPHDALIQLESCASNLEEAQCLRRLAFSHAVAEAERRGVLHPSDLMIFGDAYCRDPRTGNELFEQVTARLRQVKASLENGPFSDRDLFKSGMKEKLLQLWLAARLNDTPQRKFSTRFVVHREPQVDDDKRTDIEVSTRGFKVCIEIKPVDAKRYSATTLTDTLRKQLTKQYLKGGQNSRHGILVLFRLDTKAWKIPGGPARGSFEQLILYLKQRAKEVCVEFPEVEALDVIGIDCTVR